MTNLSPTEFPRTVRDVSDQCRVARLAPTLLLLFLLLPSPPVQAQSWHLTPLDLPYGSEPHDIVAAPDGTLYLGEGSIWAFSQGIGIHRSTDNGQSWDALYPGTTRMSPLFAWNDGTIFARYSNQMLFRNYEPFDLWRRFEFYVIGSRYINDAVQVGGKILIGTENGIGVTSDSGVTWRHGGFSESTIDRLVETGSVVAGVAMDYDGSTYRLIRTTDRGDTWSIVEPEGYVRSLRMEAGGGRIVVHFEKDRHGLIDGLHEWLPDEESLTAIDTTAAVHGTVRFTVTDQGDILLANCDSLRLICYPRTMEGPTTRPLPPWGKWINMLYMTDDGRLLAPTDGEGLYGSTDTGATWQRMDLRQLANVSHALRFWTGDLVVSVYRRGVFRLTGDHEWKPIYLNNPSFDRIAVDSSGFWWGTAHWRLYRSDDEGTSWKEVGTGNDRVIGEVIALPDSALLFSTDEGIWRWHRQNRNGLWKKVFHTPVVRSLQIAPDGSLWSLADNALLHSTDLGESWSEIPLDSLLFPSGSSPSLYITAAGTLLVSSKLSAAQLLRSTDGGLTWEAGVWPCTDPTLNMSATERGIFALSSCGIYRSGDDGRTWEHLVNVLPSITSGLLLEREGGSFHVGTDRGMYLLEQVLSVEEGGKEMDTLNLR